jgi:hypothetical protein
MKSSLFRLRNRTFAPSGHCDDMRDILSPSRGENIEVLVSWKDRLIDFHHLTKKTKFRIGSSSQCDISVPAMSTALDNFVIRYTHRGAQIFLEPEMSLELTQGVHKFGFDQLFEEGRILQGHGLGVLQLQHGEMLRIGFGNSDIALFIRYAATASFQSPKNSTGLSVNEWAALVASSLFSFIFFWMVQRQPTTDNNRVQPKVRKARFAKNPWYYEPIVVRAESKPPRTEMTHSIHHQSRKPPSLHSRRQNNSRRSRGKWPNKNPDSFSLLDLGNISQRVRDSSEQIRTSTRKAGGSVLQPGGKYSRQGLNGIQGDTPGTVKINNDKLGTRLGRGGNGMNVGIGRLQRGQIKVQSEGPIVSGGMDKEAIRRVIRQNIAAIKHCYERQLNRDPSLHGKISVRWQIGSRGSVIFSKIHRSTLKNSKVAGCVRNKIHSLKFPPPPSGQIAEVIYPFVFSAQ